MQLFVLHHDPDLAARMLCDTHLTSQSKEAVQILYTALQKLGVGVTKSVLIPGGVDGKDDSVYALPYKPVWTHPCVDWVMSGAEAMRWTIKHAESIVDEFEQRYGHKLKVYFHLQHIKAHFEQCLGNYPLLDGQLTGADWLGILDEPDRLRVESRLATVNAPTGVGFGVVAMDPEFVVFDDEGCIDCVASYLKFYTHKAKHQFVMKWRRELQPPPVVAAAFAVYDPDTPPLTVRPSKKRKNIDDEAAFPEAAALASATEAA